MQSILSHRTQTSRLSACHFATLFFNENHAESIHKCGAHSYPLRTESKPSRFLYLFSMLAMSVKFTKRGRERCAHVFKWSRKRISKSALNNTTPLYSRTVSFNISLIKLRVNGLYFFATIKSILKRCRQPLPFWKSMPIFTDSAQKLNNDRNMVIEMDNV